jgi:hypothetical protein
MELYETSPIPCSRSVGRILSSMLRSQSEYHAHDTTLRPPRRGNDARRGGASDDLIDHKNLARRRDLNPRLPAPILRLCGSDFSRKAGALSIELRREPLCPGGSFNLFLLQSLLLGRFGEFRLKLRELRYQAAQIIAV